MYLIVNKVTKENHNSTSNGIWWYKSSRHERKIVHKLLLTVKSIRPSSCDGAPESPRGRRLDVTSDFNVTAHLSEVVNNICRTIVNNPVRAPHAHTDPANLAAGITHTDHRRHSSRKQQGQVTLVCTTKSRLAESRLCWPRSPRLTSRCRCSCCIYALNQTRLCFGQKSWILFEKHHYTDSQRWTLPLFSSGDRGDPVRRFGHLISDKLCTGRKTLQVLSAFCQLSKAVFITVKLYMSAVNSYSKLMRRKLTYMKGILDTLNLRQLNTSCVLCALWCLRTNVAAETFKTDVQDVSRVQGNLFDTTVLIHTLRLCFIHHGMGVHELDVSHQKHEVRPHASQFVATVLYRPHQRGTWYRIGGEAAYWTSLLGTIIGLYRANIASHKNTLAKMSGGDVFAQLDLSACLDIQEFKTWDFYSCRGWIDVSVEAVCFKNNRSTAVSNQDVSRGWRGRASIIPSQTKQ